MSKKLVFPLCLLCSIACAQPATFPDGRWVDLSYDYSAETVFWPTADKFQLDVVAAGMTDAGYYYAANTFTTAEHGGTHLDSPIHFAEGMKTVDQILLDQLIGHAVVIDVSSNALQNKDYLISIDDLTSWEAQNGMIPDDTIVLLRTGYGKFWPDAALYLGTDKRGAEGAAELHFPGLSPEAARWLLENRKIKSIGLDTASIDYGQSQTFDSHQILMKANIPAFENVANLDQLPATGAYVFALPMKIKGGSGAPLRIVALIPN